MATPHAADPRVVPDDAVGEERFPLRPGRVLLVSDRGDGRAHPDVVALRAAGFDVHLAGSAVEALGHAIARRPDLVVLDASAAASRGLEIVRRLKAAAATRPIPVVALTCADGSLDDEALAVGCEAVVRRPIRPAQLAAEVRRRLEGRRNRPRRRGRSGRS